MDAFILLLFLAAASSLAFVLAFSLGSGKKSDHRLPPGSYGWPIMGETVEFFFGKPDKFVFDRMRKYSPDIFKTRILGEDTAVICGANGHKFLFTNDHKLFTVFRPHSMQRLFRSYKAAVPLPSPAPVASDGPAIHEEAKLFKTPGFLKPEALVRFLGKMDSITQHQMKTSWEGRKEVKAFPLAKTLSLTLTARFFLGTEEPERIARLVDYFQDVTVGTHSIMMNIPGTRFYKAQKAATAIRKELKEMIKEKKADISSGTPMHDVLSHMIMTTDPTGKHMPEEEIVGKIMGVVVSGYSSVSITMTFFMKYVGERPDIYKKILFEQMEVAAAKQPGETLTWNDLQKMKYSWNVINEVIRLMPPFQGFFREALTDVTYEGYTIPKGWKVYWTVSSTNKNPEYFPEPEKFDPSRHEDRTHKPPPYAFVPFGGGPRMCPGKEYARLAILTFIHHVVKRFEWEVMDANEKVMGDMVPIPQKGLPIRLRQR